MASRIRRGLMLCGGEGDARPVIDGDPYGTYEARYGTLEQLKGQSIEPEKPPHSIREGGSPLFRP